MYFIKNSILPLNTWFKKIIIDSDASNYQIRNSVMSSALLNASIKHSVTMKQEMFEVEHTQMEANSVHSCKNVV